MYNEIEYGNIQLTRLCDYSKDEKQRVIRNNDKIYTIYQQLNENYKRLGELLERFEKRHFIQDKDKQDMVEISKNVENLLNKLIDIAEKRERYSSVYPEMRRLERIKEDIEDVENDIDKWNAKYQKWKPAIDNARENYQHAIWNKWNHNM